MNMGNEQLDDLLQQCIKLAAQEKITAKNSWGLTLIDHINELGLERDFIRASGAIHASTKIYSGRVDRLYSDCIQVASLASGGNGSANLGNEATEKEHTGKGTIGRTNKQASASVAPESLRLPEADGLARDDHRTVALRVTVSNTQDILSLPFFLAYQNNDLSFSALPIEVQGFYADEFLGRNPDTQAMALMTQSQRVPDNTESPEYQNQMKNDAGNEIAFVEAVDAADALGYESMLDNSLMVSQLEESALDFFMEVNKDKLLRGQGHAAQAVPGAPKHVPRPRVPRKAARTFDIDFEAPIQLKIQKTKARNLQKPKEFVFLPCDQLVISAISLDHINRLLVGDFHTLQNSRLAQDANLSIVLDPSDAISAISNHVQFSKTNSFHSFNVEGVVENDMKSQSQAVYKSNVSLFKSFTTDVQNYDVNLGLQHFKLRFAQKPKVVNIHALKEVLLGEITELSGKKAKKAVTMSEISRLYPERHTVQVAREAADVGPAYQFVALLHLANERGLHLRNQGNEIEVY